MLDKNKKYGKFVDSKIYEDKKQDSMPEIKRRLQRLEMQNNDLNSKNARNSRFGTTNKKVYGQDSYELSRL